LFVFRNGRKLSDQKAGQTVAPNGFNLAQLQEDLADLK
jgi:hypothetical protein